MDAGQELLHYRLVEKIGEGGMGVVWKALDTTLSREVALKILPEAFAADPERLARFEREAKFLASLNHTNIATLHGLHEAAGVRFLTMELVEGEDLSRVLARNPISVGDALNVASQVADALEAAHEAGVVHRDLKPANIQITPQGQVKVLDFGLAKAFESDPASGDPASSLSPTMTSAGTMVGVLLGTAGYMSPEQAKGKSVDRRADIWAFGVVLLEMLTGKRTFHGETVSETLAAVMMSTPDLDGLPRQAPASLRRLLNRCLEKDPRQRLRDIGEARITIEGLLSGHAEPDSDVEGAAGSAGRRRIAPWLAAGLALGAVVAGLAAWTLKPAPRPPLRKLDVAVKDSSRLGGRAVEVCISPDGTRVAYRAEKMILIRPLDRLEPIAVEVSDDPQLLFWSPDSKWLGYGADGKLWKVPASGGESTAITELQGSLVGGRGASWGDDGTIVFSRGGTGLLEVSSRGGDFKTLLEIDPDTEGDLHEPSVLPGGKGVLYVIHRLDGDPDTLALLSGGESRVLLKIDGQNLWHPTYSSTGHILYRREPNNAGIWALPFSLDSLEVRGDPFLVAPDGDDPSVSADGTLVYVRGAAMRTSQLVWFDREGRSLGQIGQPQENLIFPELSADGNRVAVSSSENDNRDIWIHDAERATRTRLTFDVDADYAAAWTADGNYVAVTRNASGASSIYIKAADGTGDEQPFGRGELPAFSPDGKGVAVVVRNEESNRDIAYLPLEERTPGAPTTLVESAASEDGPSISPDGRYVAYFSDESGDDEVYLKRFPGGEGKWQVSARGGKWPRWNPAGGELFFVQGPNLMSVTVETASSPRLGTPVPLFSTEKTDVLFAGPRMYDVAPDGQRFVGIQNLGNADDQRGVTVVENWLEEFRERP
jgi:tRNA A-37 threonylcarbamoyl transferase component Bud32/dipeptidyl aminopeptidase/acylaminoacyl peptidase